MQFYHLGIGGGVNIFFFYSEALSATPPSTEIYEQSLNATILLSNGFISPLFKILTLCKESAQKAYS